MLRCARQRACTPSSQQTRRAGAEDTGGVGKAGRARYSSSGQWSLSVDQASPTIILVTQGVAAQEVIA